MDYLAMHKLNREPFSNSPGPDFFYLSPVHHSCLQQLEIAVRLHRGLNVVMGDVGTGKTTLCRQLILRLSETEADRDQIETHLLLDPAFGTPGEFLGAIAACFGLAGAIECEAGVDSEWQLKEEIKNHLFRRGVEEGKTVVLLIDEGQKFPEFCREILRELLNFDTNENKLLQIVIFAQSEFLQILRHHKNFTDRVNQYYFLRALNFRETTAMIRFRIAQAASPDRPPVLFSFPALLAIYRATGGYPRRIITLCHHVLLDMTIRNRRRAGWLLVRASMRQLLPPPAAPALWRGTTTALAVLLLLAAAALWLVPAPQQGLRHERPLLQTTPLALRPEPAEAGPAVNAASAPGAARRGGAAMATAPAPPQAPGGSAAASVPAAGAPPEKMPPLLGKFRVGDEGALPALLAELYGNNQAGLQQLARLNPQIADLRRVPVGEMVALPAVPAAAGGLSAKKVWVRLARKKSVEDGYRLLRDYPSDMPPVRLVASWGPKAGFDFAIVLKRGFASAKEADEALQHLPTGAAILERPEPGTVYFAN